MPSKSKVGVVVVDFVVVVVVVVVGVVVVVNFVIDVVVDRVVEVVVDFAVVDVEAVVIVTAGYETGDTTFKFSAIEGAVVIFLDPKSKVLPDV